MIVHYAVQGSVTSDDATLLDQIQDALPEQASPRVGIDYSEGRTENDDGSETISAQMSFVDDTQGEAMAHYVFEQVKDHDLANQAQDWSLRLYRTPEGGVTADEVREWYEENQSQQPTDEDGESYIPNSWDPDGFVINEITG